MKRLIIVFITLFCYLIISSCSIPTVKLAPDYKGVDERAKTYVDNYLQLSEQNHLQFHNKVTLGFKNIGRGNIIGLCTVAPYFREIDIDVSYWNSASNTNRMTLLYHELSHCYCGREHDYAEGERYPESEVERIKAALSWKINGGPRPGYWNDGCPSSIMYPVLIDDSCILSHYSQYIKEMLERCKPY